MISQICHFGYLSIAVGMQLLGRCDNLSVDSSRPFTTAGKGLLTQKLFNILMIKRILLDH